MMKLTFKRKFLMGSCTRFTFRCKNSFFQKTLYYFLLLRNGEVGVASRFVKENEIKDILQSKKCLQDTRLQTLTFTPVKVLVLVISFDGLI